MSFSRGFLSKNFFFSAFGYLNFKNDNYNILVDLLSACDKSMVLKKMSDMRSELATKLIIFSGLTVVLGLLLFAKRKEIDIDIDPF